MCANTRQSRSSCVTREGAGERRVMPEEREAEGNRSGCTARICPGPNLGRAEMGVMLQEVVARLGDFEVDGPVQRLRSNFINGIKHLPVAWSTP